MNLPRKVQQQLAPENVPILRLINQERKKSLMTLRLVGVLCSFYLVHGAPQFPRQNRFRITGVEGRHAVLQGGQRLEVRQRQQVAANAQALPDFDESGAQSREQLHQLSRALRLPLFEFALRVVVNLSN